jgi:hypothetical protein
MHEVPNTDNGLGGPAVEQDCGRGGVADRHPHDDAGHLRVHLSGSEHVLGVVDVVGGLHEHDVFHADG